MALPPALQGLGARYKALSKGKQMVLMFGAPVLVAAVFAYFTWDAMGRNGEDEQLPTILQRPGIDGSFWSQIIAVRADIDAQNVKIQRRPQLLAKLATLDQQTKEIEKLLPREEEKTEIRQMLDTLNREIPPDYGKVNVNKVSINEQASARNSDYRSVLYQIDLTGSLNGVIAFMDAIEKPSPRNPRFMSINKIIWQAGKVQTGADGKADLKPHEVHLEVMTYIYTPKAGKKPR